MEILSSKKIFLSSSTFCNTQNIVQFIVLTRWQIALLTYPMTFSRYPSHCKQWESQGQCKRRRWKRRRRKYGWMMDVKIKMKSATKDLGDRCEPIIEESTTPKPECLDTLERAIEDTLWTEDPDEIPMIKLSIKEFMQNVQNYIQEKGELEDVDMSRALVALTQEAATISMPKLKNASIVCEQSTKSMNFQTHTLSLQSWIEESLTIHVHIFLLYGHQVKLHNQFDHLRLIAPPKTLVIYAARRHALHAITCEEQMHKQLRGMLLMVSADAPVLLSKACELFIMELT